MTTKERLERSKRLNRWMLTVSLIVFVSLYHQAFARIGETPEQCQTRYGNPIRVDKDKNANRFKKGGILITVFFYDGKADCICYEKSEVNGAGKHIKLSENEIQRLLEINGGERKWKETKIISERKEWEKDCKYWETENGELLAAYYNSALDDPLYIQTKENKARGEAEIKAQEAEIKAQETEMKAQETEMKTKAKADVKKILEGF